MDAIPKSVSHIPRPSGKSAWRRNGYRAGLRNHCKRVQGTSGGVMVSKLD